ncbi:thioredoxin family protein [Streptococcus hillyeri]|uniref:Thioredoxin n=1 Tax=Streptococcus hillyeri TaxID=2282420 RepID=A0A3L9DSP4_9STRE|nr:thioredoxin family protein [Streptococcus hillyeri]RLY03258.1 thioredoxin [Streptococcus hillyeri]
MIIPKSVEELATYVESSEKVVFFFTADWCPDCQFIYPAMPEIEAQFPEMTFVRVDRDEHIELAQTWNIFGIPSFVVTQDGKELGRFVNKLRKSKEEIIRFLEELA